jgi:acetyl esterase/lipase
MRPIIVLLFLATACAHPQQRTAPVGLAGFARHSRFVDAKISPGGTYLAAISTDGGRRALSIVDLRTRKLASTFNPKPESVGTFSWANDNRVLIQLWTEYEGYLAEPVNHGNIYSLDAATGRGHVLFGYGAVHQLADGGGSAAFGRVLSRVRGDDQHVLIVAGGFEDGEKRPQRIVRLQVDNGVNSTVIAGPMLGASFITDETGEPRIAHGLTNDLKPRYFYRDKGGAWDELGSLKGIGRSSSPLELEAQARTLIVAEPADKVFGVFALNIDSGEKKLLSKNDWTGPDHFLEDKNQQVLAVHYDADLPSWDFIVPDHPLSRALKGMLAAYPDDDVRIVSTTDDEKKAVVFVYGDRNPGRFLLLDVGTLKAEELVASRPWVDSNAMSETIAFHTKASDGMWIHGYVTRPKSAAPGVAPPMVVLPHGGPHFVRDEWGYDPEVQVLASEGFAVLQVNYRGSSGYGLGFQEAGYTHWGDRMIEDIVDATRYAVGKGYADSKRICSFGASYGAFAALQSAILAPELYRCAVGYSGIYDLTLMATEGDTHQSASGRGFIQKAIGTDQAKLKQQSPVYNADKLKAKVLLIHGQLDNRAPIEHAERMKRALEKAGAPPGWLVEPLEAHGFYDEGARERMLTRLVAFLHENLH